MSYRETFFVKPGRHLSLKDIDPSDRGRHESKESAKDEIEHYRDHLSKMQSVLYAEKKWSLLIVLQAMDAGGKDGTINHVMNAWNAQGARVTSFKQPTPEEAAHDFLWRIHTHAPARGEIAIFNRSHYEDVLVTRVHGLIGKALCEARYQRIREFEDELASTDTAILKFFLHISKDEQLERFAARLDDPRRNWKISEADYAERVHWDSYMAAYEDAIGATSTKRAPWFVIPANHKWFRDLAVSQILADAMEGLHMSYPKPSVDLADIRRKYHAAAAEEKKEKKKRGK
jgi:PPK2 family polyphosphate:nucleotide phosphotransferase